MIPESNPYSLLKVITPHLHNNRYPFHWPFPLDFLDVSPLHQDKGLFGKDVYFGILIERAIDPMNFIFVQSI